jgi:hypothetical protein
MYGRGDEWIEGEKGRIVEGGEPDRWIDGLTDRWRNR